jgi:hypothetical protein
MNKIDEEITDEIEVKSTDADEVEVEKAVPDEIADKIEVKSQVTGKITSAGEITSELTSESTGVGETTSVAGELDHGAPPARFGRSRFTSARGVCTRASAVRAYSTPALLRW